MTYLEEKKIKFFLLHLLKKICKKKKIILAKIKNRKVNFFFKFKIKIYIMFGGSTDPLVTLSTPPTMIVVGTTNQ